MSRGRENPSLWISKADNWVAGRLDRKLLIHTTSYPRAQTYLAASRWASEGVLMTHKSRDAEKAVGQFEARSAPCVLVTPALVRGVSLDGDKCRGCLITKVPWPDPRNPVTKARTAIDPDYPSYVAMQTLEQEAGRVVRGAADWAEIAVLDDDIIWAWRKYQHFASAAFREAWGGSVDRIPPAPPLDFGG
jgi:Rad3-related DNA helicase